MSVTQVQNFFIVGRGERAEKFVEGTTATVTLTNEIGDEIFKKSFNQQEEFQEFIKNHIFSFPGYSMAVAAVVPARTSWEGLVKDIFCPTVVNHSFTKQEGIVKKVGGIVAGLCIDLITLIPRVAATPFRMFYTNNAEHPLVELLSPEALKGGCLVAHMDLQMVQIEENGSNGKDWKNFSAVVKTAKVSQPIIAHPDIPCPIRKEIEMQTKIASYEGQKKTSNGHTFIDRHLISSSSKKTITYHFFSGFDHSALEPVLFSDQGL